MSEVSMCEYCGQLQHFKLCDEAKIALFDEIKVDRDGLRGKVEELGFQIECHECRPPDFVMNGEYSECGPEDEPIMASVKLNSGDPSVGIGGGWELDGASPAAEYIRGIEVERDVLKAAAILVRKMLDNPHVYRTEPGLLSDLLRRALETKP